MVEVTSPENVERVVERIRKLLALSTSSNAHEAALAAERAVEIAQRYNLDLAALESVQADPYIEQVVDVGAAAAWRWLLMSSVARANFCRALRRRVAGRHAAEMFLLGERHNIAVAEFLYHYLARELDRLTERSWRRASWVYGQHVSARSWKHDFRRGAVATIDERLSERAARFAAESGAASALVHAKDAGLIAALNRHYPNIPTRRVPFRGSHDAYRHGQSAARAIALQDALATSPTGQPMLR